MIKREALNCAPRSAVIVEGTPKTDPVGYEYTSNSFSSDVWDRYGFGPPGEMIGSGEQITISLRWRKRNDNIEVNVIKACISGSESSKGCQWQMVMAELGGARMLNRAERDRDHSVGLVQLVCNQDEA